MLQGVPQQHSEIEGPLKSFVNEKSGIVHCMVAEERVAPVRPVHLIFSVWALTQNDADFDGQEPAMLAQSHDPLVKARDNLETLCRRRLAPGRALHTIKGKGSLFQ